MLEELYRDAESRMQKSIDALKQSLLKLRTGRAHPSLLDSVFVSYYGTPTPLNQVASVTAEDARTLSITPWEKSLMQEIDKAIRASDLGLNPSVSGDTVRVPLPPLTEERRRELVKQLKAEAEETRIAVRNIRRDINGQVKQKLKSKEITEDEERRAQEKVQKILDQRVADIDKLVVSKETELMVV